MLGSLAACEVPAGADVESPSPPTARTCGENGAVSAAIFGGIQTEIEWSADDIACDSMQRPDGEGVRLRFVGDASGERLAIIIAMPGLGPGESKVEIPSNVTATVEGSGRFFSTPNLESCWTEVTSQTALPGKDEQYVIVGTLFCIASLGEINGDAAVSIPEFSFSAVVDWSGK